MADLVIVVPSLFPGLWWSLLAPLEPSKAKGLVEMAQMRHFDRWEGVLHWAAFAKGPEEVSGDAYGLVHLKMSFTT